MSRFSQERGVELLTTEECVQLFGKSLKTIKRALRTPGVYVEKHREARHNKRGAKSVNYIDPSTLPFWTENDPLKNDPLKSSEGQVQRVTKVSEGQLENSSPGRQNPKLSTKPVQVSEGHEKGGSAHLNVPLKLTNSHGTHDAFKVSDLTETKERLEQLRPILALPEGERHGPIEVLAKREGVHPRTVYRWISEYDQEGLRALGRKPRGDKGALRIPSDTVQLVTQALVSNTVNTSVAMIHRTLLRAVPEVMQYTSGGTTRTVSASTVNRIKQRLLDDPYGRLLFYDADKRKEHLRAYAGEVFAAYANQLWQMDMTRCDVLVCDPETGDIFRPRIHAIIDVYSGAIPGLAFAREEDQTQTDLALLRAFSPKPAPYTDIWPVFGICERMYWDNGKTYSSDHARRMLSELGIEVIYSKPRVSHTRGKIERFFGTFHGYEKTLPGYVGENAKNRATEELRRVEKNTKKWLERGGSSDPGRNNRLLTLAEYQQTAMDWLLGEYHRQVVHGQTRLEHFTGTVPARLQPLHHYQELMLVLARRASRVVNPDGSVRLNNRYWTLESGELINYANKEVLVLTNQFEAGEEHLVAWRDIADKLHVLGQLVPMPERALSTEGRAQRVASEAAARRALKDAKRIKGELMNPTTIVSNALREQVQAELALEPLPKTEHPRARITAVNPKDELPDDEFTRFLLNPPDYGTDDPKEILKRSKKRWAGGKHD